MTSSTWQLIETAPKDGTWFLATYRNPDSGHWMLQTVIAWDGGWVHPRPSSGLRWASSLSPWSHWQHLPALPAFDDRSARTWTLPTPRGDSRKDKVACFLRQDGLCGCGCGAKLSVKGFILEHIVPLEDGGADDLSNKAAFSIPCAKAKTKVEATERAKVRLKRDKHIGAVKPKSSFQTNRNGPYKAKIGGGVERR